MPSKGAKVTLMARGWTQEPSIMHDPDGIYIGPYSAGGDVAEAHSSIVRFNARGNQDAIDNDRIYVHTSNYDEMFPYQRLVARLKEAKRGNDEPEYGAPMSSRFALEEYVKSLHPELAGLLDAQEDY